MEKHTLSVVVPNYNHAHYIGEALEAVLSQSFRPLEVIVVDDASTDNSIEVIEAFTRRDSIIRLLRNERNMGVIFTGHRGLEHTSGDYVYFAAADDKVLPGLFEKCMNLLSQYPQAGLCSSNAMIIDEQGRVLSEAKIDGIREPCYMPPASVLANLRRNPNSIMHTPLSVMFKRSAFIESGGMIPELGFLCDWFIQHVMSLVYGACYMPEPLASWRVSDTQYNKVLFRQTNVAKDIYAYALYLMTGPKYSEIFPQDFISLCERSFADRLKTSLRAQLRHRQSVFFDELPNLKTRPRATDTLLFYCIKQLGRMQRLLGSWYCSRDFATELDEAVNRLRSGDN